MYIIETERIGLRNWKASDEVPFTAMNQDPRVMEFFPSLLTLEDSFTMIERIKTFLNKNPFGFWAAEEKQSGSFIGFVGLSRPRFQTDFTPCVEIGWRLAHQFWGKGYAPEAASACIAYSFEKLRIPEILSFTSILNKRSISVMEKIGMKYVKNFDHPLIEEISPLRPHVLYAIRNF
jgi:RimJ/RimL family protein N-acetyltransferase